MIPTKLKLIMKKYGKILIFVFIIFHTTTVILTIENSQEDDDRIPIQTFPLENHTGTKYTSSIENPSSSAKTNTLKRLWQHKMIDNKRTKNKHNQSGRLKSATLRYNNLSSTTPRLSDKTITSRNSSKVKNHAITSNVSESKQLDRNKHIKENKTSSNLLKTAKFILLHSYVAPTNIINITSDSQITLNESFPTARNSGETLSDKSLIESHSMKPFTQSPLREDVIINCTEKQDNISARDELGNYENKKFHEKPPNTVTVTSKTWTLDSVTDENGRVLSPQKKQENSLKPPSELRHMVLTTTHRSKSIKTNDSSSVVTFSKANRENLTKHDRYTTIIYDEMVKNKKQTNYITNSMSLLNKLFRTREMKLPKTVANSKTTTDTSIIEGIFTFSSEYDTAGVIRSEGYPVETHKVQTEDGYILTVHRIPLSRDVRPGYKNRLPIYIQHGLWSSSYHWFETKPQYALPFILSDAGYDVWLGNARGNVISQEHAFLSSETNSSYWDFSFHEMGLYDLPAVIEYILQKTNKTQLNYIGHSMGTTMFFVMASMRPAYASKVHFMMALAPIATVGPIHPIFRLTLLIERFILTRDKHLTLLAKNGISLKTLLHYMQLYVTGEFSMYDYGKIANMDIYKSIKSPRYDLTSITLPIVLCYGTEDSFLRREDLKTLSSLLGNALGIWPVPLTHFQFTGGRQSKDYLYKYIPLHLH